jgi:hypothetical protein
MKTFELPDNLADALIATGKELATQGNLATAWPVWYVTEEKEIIAPEDRADHKKRLDDDFIDPDEDLCASCLEKWKEQELPAECDDYKCEDSFYHYNLERQFTSYGSEFFLTQKACQEYIDDNAYHFRNPKPYAGSAHRNYELQPIIQALILMAGEKVPSNHYGVVQLERRDDGTGSDMWPERKK